MAATQPRHRRRKNNTTTELPVDVIFNNILPRLPAKYVKKYLCVSKEWYSFLRSPMFANMHVNHATNDDHQNHHKLLVLYEKGSKSGSKKGKPCYFNRDCETQKPGMRGLRLLPFDYSSGQMFIESSCNGLVLVAIRNFGSELLTKLIIWNPLTNDYKTLSKTNLKIAYYNTTFKLYYNSSEQDYRVLLITVEEAVYIYSLKLDSWREINFDTIPLGLSPSTCWNEKLYFERYTVIDSITMFDTKTEKFTNIPIPFQDKDFFSVIVQRGCLYMCQISFSNDEPCIKLWSKQRTTGSWEEVSIYTRMQDIAHIYLEPLHLMCDGNWLMAQPDNMCNYYYYKVDLENKHNEGGPYPYKLQGSGVYIETFVSPNQYMN